LLSFEQSQIDRIVRAGRWLFVVGVLFVFAWRRLIFLGGLQLRLNFVWISACRLSLRLLG
jgi:hypothetical protein